MTKSWLNHMIKFWHSCCTWLIDSDHQPAAATSTCTGFAAEATAISTGTSNLEGLPPSQQRHQSWRSSSNLHRSKTPKPNPPKAMPTASAPAAPLPPPRRPVHPVDMWILWVCLQRLPLRILGVAKAGVAKPENILSNGRLRLRILNMWFSLVHRAVEPRLQWLQLHPWWGDLQMDTQDQPVSAASNSLNSTQ